jgi:hypothetical protein
LFPSVRKIPEVLRVRFHQFSCSTSLNGQETTSYGEKSKEAKTRKGKLVYEKSKR